MNRSDHRLRLAVAEEEKENMPAPRLGRALRFALFDAFGSDIRGPFYRVRHDDPGGRCDGHAELFDLLRDCQVVIAGSAGARISGLLRQHGIEVVTTPERQVSTRLVARHLAGTLAKDAPSPRASSGTKPAPPPP